MQGSKREWVCAMVCVCVCVCVLRGGREGPIYTTQGRFPPNAYKEGNQVPWPRLIVEMHLDWLPARSADT